MAKYDGLIIPRSYNDYFPRSAPREIVDVLLRSGEKWPVTSGGTGADNAADARANLGIFTDNALDTDSENPVQNKVIANLIPAQASESNKLADKEFVNSSIGTNTANYIFKTDEAGENVPFDSVDELEAYSGTITNNDYAFVTGIDDDGNRYYDRYKASVTAGVVTWGKEYRLNNSSFTSEQWAAIQSGITAELVAKIGAELPTPTNVDKLVISARDGDALKWVEIDKDKVGEITTKCTKEEWKNKPLAERKALAGSAVDITDDYDEVDNNVYSFIERIIGWYIDEYGVKKPIYRKILVTTIGFTGSTSWSDFCYYCGSPILNIKKLLKADFVFEKGWFIYLNNANSIHIARSTSSRTIPIGSEMIIEYTKITD